MVPAYEPGNQFVGPDRIEFGCLLIDTRGWRSPSESAPSLPVLLDALWRDRQVRFIYDSVLHEASERTVDPLGLVARGSAWYLIAKRQSELRTYRVSRIRHVEISDTVVRRPEDFDLANYWERSATEFREKLPQYRATFLAKPAVMHWIRYRGWRLEEEQAEGERVRVQLRFDVEEEALQFSVSFGTDVEVLEPASLRAKARDRALGVIGLYRKATPVFRTRCGTSRTGIPPAQSTRARSAPAP
jgi:predicted DNA-binding transcriptional regulator YafY